MIDPKSLRIGNLVEYTGDLVQCEDGIMEVHVIGRELSAIGINSFDCRKEINPIPLTPEWLERMGFTKNLDFDWHRDYLWNEYTSESGFDCAEFNGDGYIFVGCGLDQTDEPIKYVHQLQNLYFALTGDELTVKEEG